MSTKEFETIKQAAEMAFDPASPGFFDQRYSIAKARLGSGISVQSDFRALIGEVERLNHELENWRNHALKNHSACDQEIERLKDELAFTREAKGTMAAMLASASAEAARLEVYTFSEYKKSIVNDFVERVEHRAKEKQDKHGPVPIHTLIHAAMKEIQKEMESY